MPLLLPEVKELLSEKDFDSLRALLQELLPVDIVELLELLPPASQVAIFNLLELSTACEVIEQMEVSDAIYLLKLLSEPMTVKILNNMAHDMRADIFSAMPKEEAPRLLARMDPDEARDVKKLLGYHPETAGGIMTTEYAWIPSDITVEQAIDLLRKKATDFEFYQVYVLHNKKLLGVVPLRELIVSSPQLPVKKLTKKIPTVPMDMDQERVTALIARYDLTSIPVINRERELQGVITVDDVLDVIVDEHTEDMHKFGGSAPLTQSYLDVGVLGLAKSRLPWLIVLLLASFVSGFVMEKFSPVIRAMVNLVIFIPVLLNCSGNAGMQSASTVIRGLATGEIKFDKLFKVLRKEFLIGVIMGIALGVLIAMRSLPVQRSITFGLSVGISMAAGITVATVIGTLLPIIFEKLGFDPALMSGPLLTTLMDSTSLLIYFSVAVKLCGL